VHTSSALTVTSPAFQPQLCLRALACVKTRIVEALDAALYIPAQLRILQNIFEGREAVVVAAADRIMITGGNFCSRLDGFL
jgi:hypothetical protein